MEMVEGTGGVGWRQKVGSQRERAEGTDKGCNVSGRNNKRGLAGLEERNGHGGGSGEDTRSRGPEGELGSPPTANSPLPKPWIRRHLPRYQQPRARGPCRPSSPAG